MATEVSEPTRRRRHGQQLEAALLEAGWQELVEVGYAHLTMGSVARRAHTSEPVLYRRWANKDQLVLAAFKHQRTINPIATPDTGALRSDLLDYLTTAGNALAGHYAIALATVVSGLRADTGMTLADVRTRVMGGYLHPYRRTIYQRAHHRGEIDMHLIPIAVLDMPFQLLRHDVLMNLEPPTPARIRSIVDDVFLMAVRGYQPGRSRAPRLGGEGEELDDESRAQHEGADAPAASLERTPGGYQSRSASEMPDLRRSPSPSSDHYSCWSEA